MESILYDLKNRGYLNVGSVNGDEVLHLSTPCRFVIDKNTVDSLRSNYTPNEEIGGVLWVKPAQGNGETVFLIEKVTYLRNAIEDKPRNDHRNKSNAYLSDREERKQEFANVFMHGCLPITFHTHPLREHETLAAINELDISTETSNQDQIESAIHYMFDGQKLLMPRALIVGNALSTRDMFIGIYNGMIAPLEFKGSKQDVQQENLERFFDKISAITLTDAQKIGLIAGFGLLVFLSIKYPKYSLPIAMGLLASLPIFMTNTDKIDSPNYFNKLSRGGADIFIP